MKDKFQGPDGQRRLVEVICAQPMIEYNAPLAQALIAAGSLIDFAPRENLTTQGNFENHVYFLIAGEVSILVNGKAVGSRKSGESIGEMFLASPLAPRTATVCANGPVLALRVSYNDFQKVANAFPLVWRSVARISIERLIDKSALQRPTSAGPIIFLSSSSDGLPLSRFISDAVKHFKSIPKVWSTPGVFSPYGAKLDSFLKEVRRTDYAIFVFGPDDKSALRAPEAGQRDNLILELGLFMATLDANRIFIIKEHASDIKIPADLSGVTYIPYTSKPGQPLSTTVTPICEELLAAMTSHGLK
jgi:CRP/FNR family transcriptional regulator, cyclic AMP receptor protein